MKNRIYIVGLLSGIFMLLFHTVSYANSSWHWVTSSPLAVLPFAVIFTLLIEIAAIFKTGKIADLKRILLVVGLANMVSFLAPYFFRAYRFIPTSGGFSLLDAFHKGPYYMVLTGYLVLTLIVELPIVYLLLKKYAGNQRGLIGAILASNVATTLLVAVSERLLCQGRW